MNDKIPSCIMVESHREVRTYSEMWHASSSMLKISDEFGKGQTWLLMASALFTAFAFEAYLNHVGPRVDPRWEQKSRERLFIRNKLEHISEIFGVNWPRGWTSEPLKTLEELISFRNTLAHAKSEELKPPPSLHPADQNPLDDVFYRPLSKWE